MLRFVTKKALIGAFFYFAVHPVWSECGSVTPVELSNYSSGRVSRVVDADTVHLKDGRKIRLLGIDAPEINHKDPRGSEPFADVAKVKVVQMLPVGERIYFVTDKQTNDRYQRTLAHVYDSSGQLIGAQLIKQGLAQVLTIPPNTRYADCLFELEKAARKSKLGIWSSPSSKPIKAAQVPWKKGVVLVEGQITEIHQSARHLWITLDDRLKVGIKTENLEHFLSLQPLFHKGKHLTVRGFAYPAFGKLHMKISHSSAVLALSE